MPIGSFEMIQRKFAMLAADCYAADAAWMLTASMVDRGGIDFSLETAAVQDVRAPNSPSAPPTDCMQIAGGIGYSKEYPYEQAGARRAHQHDLRGDERDPACAHRAHRRCSSPASISRRSAKRFSDPLHSIGAIRTYIAGRVKRQVVKSVFTQVHPALEKEADLVATVIHDLALGVEKLLIEHGKEIIEHQFHQERMANAAIDIYLSTAALSRATAALEAAGSVEGAQADVDNARIFIPPRCGAPAARCARSSATRMRVSRHSPSARWRQDRSP